MLRTTFLAFLIASTVAAMAQAPPIGQGGAAPGPAFQNRGPHIHVAGPPITLQNCGTGAMVYSASSTFGTFQVGTGATTCTIKFAIPYTVLPGDDPADASAICLVIPNSMGAGLVETDYDANGFTITPATPGWWYVYFCVGSYP